MEGIIMKYGKLIKSIAAFVGVASLGLVFNIARPAQASADKISAATSSELKQKGTLTIGLEGTFAPYSYRKDGKLTGFEVELGKDIAKQMGLKAKFVPTKWDGLIEGVNTGKYDIVLNNITVTKERQAKFGFSTPYIYSHFALISKKGSGLNTLKDIKGVKIASGTGTDNSVVAKKFGAKVVPSSEFSTSLDMVRQGRVKGTINSMSAWYAYKKDGKNVKGLQAKDVSKDEKPAKISALMAKKNTDLKKDVDKALKQLRNDGTLTKLSKKYVGGDITK